MEHSTFNTTVDIYARPDVTAQRETGTAASTMFDKLITNISFAMRIANEMFPARAALLPVSY